MSRRQLLASGGLAMASAATPLGAEIVGAPSAGTGSNAVVKLHGEGLSLTPEELAGLLQSLTARGLEPDYYSNGGAVAEMEEAFARELGKERAVFFPTGTLANHVAIRVLAKGDTRVLLQERSHVHNDSGDCVQVLSHLAVVPLSAGEATFTADEVKRELRRAEMGRVRTGVGVISIECPVRRKLGELFDFGEMKRVAALARDNGIRLHLDGARLYVASAYTGIPVSDYSALFDTVYISLWKCFNAPFGAVLAGPASLLDEIYHLRRMFGGGLPYAWPAAAVAAHYREGYLDRFRVGMERFELVLRALEGSGHVRVERIPNGTNNAKLKWEGGPSPAVVRERLAAQGVLLSEPARYFRGLFLTANETLARMEASRLAELLLQAVG